MAAAEEKITATELKAQLAQLDVVQKESREEVLIKVQQYGGALEYADESLQNDRQILQIVNSKK